MIVFTLLLLVIKRNHPGDQRRYFHRTGELLVEVWEVVADSRGLRDGKLKRPIGIFEVQVASLNRSSEGRVGGLLG